MYSTFDDALHYVNLDDIQKSLLIIVVKNAFVNFDNSSM